MNRLVENADLVDASSWHAQAWQRLDAAYQRQQLAHALLISGVPGIAKGRFAEQLVAKLFCLSPNDGRACGQCKNCHLVAADTHPDLITIKLQEDKKRIGVEQVRETLQKLEKTAQIGPVKVAIIRQLELLTRGAFNAILKTLEEPGRDTYWVLQCEQLQDVPATIKSRCLHVPLFPLSKEMAEAWLLTQGYTQPAIANVWPYCPGAPLSIQYWLDNDVLSEREKFRQNLHGLASGQLSLSENIDVTDQDSIPFLIDALYEEVLIKVRERSVQPEKAQDRQNRSYLNFLQQVLDEKRYVQMNQGANRVGVWSSLLISWIELHQELIHSSKVVA